MQLRPYQQIAVTQIINSQSKNICRQCPTGTGKSREIEYYVNYLMYQNKKVLIITPREELCENLVQYFGDIATIASGKYKPDLGCKILVSTYQSANKYINLFQPDVIISDECHLAMAKTWKNLVKGYKHVGWTATTERLDGKPLSKLFDELIKDNSLQWFIDHHYLSPVNFELSEYSEFVTDKIGDDLKTQNDVYTTIPEIEKTINLVKSLKGKTIIFCCTVDHCNIISQKLNELLIYNEVVTSKTPKKLRKEIFRDFKSNSLDILINVDLFTMGVDIPKCENVVLNRFTFSEALFFQQIGRVTRLDPKNPNKIGNVYDLVGNVYHHGNPLLKDDWSINSTKRYKAKSNKDSKWFKCYECDTDLILKNQVKSIIEIECPNCKTLNIFKPNNGKNIKIIEKHIYELSIPTKYHLEYGDVIAFCKSNKYKNTQKLMKISRSKLPKKCKTKILSYIGVDSRTIKNMLS